MKTSEIENVSALLLKAAKAHTPLDAMQFSQAALNCAHAIASAAVAKKEIERAV